MKFMPVSDFSKYPTKEPQIKLDWDAKERNGQECAKALKNWMKKCFTENSHLQWADQSAWDEALILSTIVPKFLCFHCNDPDGCYSGKYRCSGSILDSMQCDADDLHVFDYVAPIGEDLLILERYLDPEFEKPIFEDLEESQKYAASGGFWGYHKDTTILSADAELRVKIKVIWAFVVDWIKKNVLNPFSQANAAMSSGDVFSSTTGQPLMEEVSERKNVNGDSAVIPRLPLDEERDAVIQGLAGLYRGKTKPKSPMASLRKIIRKRTEDLARYSEKDKARLIERFKKNDAFTPLWEESRRRAF